MFTINIYLRFALMAIGFIGGILLWVYLGLGYAWPLLLMGIILLIGYLLLGTIQSAAVMVQEMNFDGAEKRLGLTLSPKLLYVTNRAFFYIMKGSIAMHKKDMNAAEDLFDTALNLKLPSDNERAMVLLQLANINGSKNKWKAAQNYFREAKKLRVTEGQIKDQMNQFEKALGNQGQMKTALAGGKRGIQMMQGGGGKRRRPKMR